MSETAGSSRRVGENTLQLKKVTLRELTPAELDEVNGVSAKEISGFIGGAISIGFSAITGVASVLSTAAPESETSSIGSLLGTAASAAVSGYLGQAVSEMRGAEMSQQLS